MGGEAATRAGISQSQTLPNRLRRQEVNTQKLLLLNTFSIINQLQKYISQLCSYMQSGHIE